MLHWTREEFAWNEVYNGDFCDDYDWNAIVGDLEDMGYVAYYDGANSGFGWTEKWDDLDDDERMELTDELMQRHDNGSGED